MAKRQRVWAKKVRNALRRVLGDCCVVCGATRKLEFDLIMPIDTRHHKIEWSSRMSFYRREHARGNVQLLCRKHNAKKSNQMELLRAPEIEIPF